MNRKYKLFRFSPLLSIPLLSLLAACHGGGNDPEVAKLQGPDSTGGILKVNGELFSIPSPLQTGLLIKKLGISFNKEMLNPSAKATSYSTSFQKALNLGVYGADLGYVTIYDQTQEAISFMNSVKKMADDLGISSAFNAETFARFQKNLGNRDSLLGLVSIAYRESDAFLKNNERNDVSGLVLAGGWVESLYFATSVYKMNSKEEVKRRIGEQKSSLGSLIKLLAPYSSQADYAELLDNLNDLDKIFKGVQFIYNYSKPVVEADKKLTTINSSTEVKISQAQLDSITHQVKVLRTLISG